MGLIINQQLDIPAKAVFDRLELKYNQQEGDELIFDGGPIQQDRGFILHSASGQKWESTIHIGSDISLTTSKDILGDIALGTGPKDALITLGYSSWGGGQLEEELKDNSWLVIPADSAVLFKTDCAQARPSGGSIHWLKFRYVGARIWACIIWMGIRQLLPLIMACDKWAWPLVKP
jgi:putative transcriptional regulator